MDTLANGAVGTAVKTSLSSAATPSPNLKLLKSRHVDDATLIAHWRSLLAQGLRVIRHGQTYIEAKLCNAHLFCDVEAIETRDPLNDAIVSDRVPGLSGTIRVFRDASGCLQMTSHEIRDLQLIFYWNRLPTPEPAA